MSTVPAKPVCTGMNKFPVNPLKDPQLRDKWSESDCAFEFSHTIEEQIGGQLRAGFTLTDLYEDIDPGGLLAHYNFPEYVATRAVKASYTPGATTIGFRARRECKCSAAITHIPR